MWILRDGACEAFREDSVSNNRHALYGKIIRSDSCVKDRDEKETAGVGDRVRIEETRPLPTDKRFRLVEIIERRASFL